MYNFPKYSYYSIVLCFMFFVHAVCKHVQDSQDKNDKKCFENLGCFGKVNARFPEDEAASLTKFMLYTPSKPNTGVDITDLSTRESQLQKARFSDQDKMIVIIPGFSTEKILKHQEHLKEAFQEFGNFSIIIMDYHSRHAQFLEYPQETANAMVSGAQLALLVRYLRDQFDYHPRNVHIIGHSLGSHVAGFAGKRIPGLGRITGLDPAGILFEKHPPDQRLDSTDADFVDIIHTRAATSIIYGLGIVGKIGDIDFYPNGGEGNADCVDLINISRLFYPLYFYENMYCDHFYSFWLFILSIKMPNKMMAMPCQSWSKFKDGACGSCEKSRFKKSCIPIGYHSEKYAKERKLSKLPYFLNFSFSDITVQKNNP